jgi:hypothetical protein
MSPQLKSYLAKELLASASEEVWKEVLQWVIMELS